jgi:two-component system, cell cycle response regulator DivK
MQRDSATILIVDDDARNIFALTAVLRSKGYHCIPASGAEEALGILQKEKNIRIVLMDMMMPEMDGYGAIKRIQEQIKDPPLVVAVTAKAMKGDREKALAAGADDYIPKPVDVDHLLALLTRYIK